MLRSLKKGLVLVITLVSSFILFSHSVLAAVPFTGEFTATDNCEALVSIRKGTNPDNLKLKQGETYQVVAQNSDRPSHYLVEIDDAQPNERWVDINCFSAGPTADTTIDQSKNTNTSTYTGKTRKTTDVVTTTSGKQYLLALSWQPAFCESKPDKTECRTLATNPNRPEATHFALHGLWPQPESQAYCGVSQNDRDLDKSNSWADLPAVENQLSPATWSKLQAAMPGTASYLQRHEWTKHGTCYSSTPEEYFSEEIILLDAFNKSSVEDLVARNIGKQVSVQDINQALNDFGPNTGDKVEIKCTGGVLSEIWLNLEGNITPESSIADLLRDSPNARKEKITSCLIDDARS